MFEEIKGEVQNMDWAEISMPITVIFIGKQRAKANS